MLLGVNLAAKFITLALFVIYVRVLSPDLLALVALVPTLAALIFGILGLGVATNLERQVPAALERDPSDGTGLLKSGLLWLVLVSLASGVALWLCAPWVATALLGGSGQAGTVRLMAMPVAGHLVFQAACFGFQLRGRLRTFAYLRSGGDIVSKACGLAGFFLTPGAFGLLGGLAAGYLLAIAAAAWLGSDLFSRGTGLAPAERIFRSSGYYYLETQMTVFRNHGDNLVVTMLLGPPGLAVYYVVKRLAEQLQVVLQPVQLATVPFMSRASVGGVAGFYPFYAGLWRVVPPACLYLSVALAAGAPVLLPLVAGDAYGGHWPAAAVLCLVTGLLAILAINTRGLLILGSADSRLRVTLGHLALLVVFIFAFAPRYGVDGVAVAWLLATLGGLFLSTVMLRGLGLALPPLGPTGRAAVYGGALSLFSLMGYPFTGTAWLGALWYGGAGLVCTLLYFKRMGAAEREAHADYVPDGLRRFLGLSAGT